MKGVLSETPLFVLFSSHTPGLSCIVAENIISQAFPSAKAVESGEIDANYFQHVPYLDDFNAENGTHLVSVLVVHVEPMGLYGGKQTSLDALNK